jgi:AAA family ATP:ADP antiporter
MENANSLQFKRIITLYIMGFLLIFGYSFARPCIDSIYLEHYSSDTLPNAWLITAFCSIFVIAFYNRINQKFSILSLYGWASLVCAGLLSVLLVAYFAGFVPAIFILYIWKELYMVVLMETYWSFADMVFSISTARHTYGLAMAMSSLGGVFGNLLVGPFARAVGSRWALCSLVIMLILGFVIAYCARSIGDEKPQANKKKTDVGVGIKTLFQSKYLVPLAVLVCTVQVVIGLIDYRFNSMLQENYVNTDMRTEMLGYIHAAVNVVGISIQVFTGPILKIFGIGNTFKSIPFLLAAFMLAFVVMPSFAIMLAVKISSKALDYSLLRGVKEILYIPLSREEKTQGKGLIDIFMYRMARGFSSILLMGLIAVGLTAYVMELSLLLVILWLVLAIIIARRYQGLVVNQEDI